MKDANHSEIERLRCLHRGVVAGVTAFKRLFERSPEDELRLRMLQRLEQRLTYRIDWLLSQLDVQDKHAGPRSRPAAAPESARALAF